MNYLVEVNVTPSPEEAKIIEDYKGSVLTDDDIIAIFRLGVAKGREIEASLTPQSVCYEH